MPVYDRLGDVRSRAVTMSRIADIREARGDLDGALSIHEQDRRPIAEQLGDVDSLVHILLCVSRIRVAKGIDSQESFERVFEDLSDAYGRAKKLTRLDFICAAAADLGELLAKAGAYEPARALLGEVRDGYVNLQQSQSAARIDAWLAQIDAMAAGDTVASKD